MKFKKILICMFTLFVVSNSIKPKSPITPDPKTCIPNPGPSKRIKNCDSTSDSFKIFSDYKCPKCSANLGLYMDGIRCSNNNCKFSAQLTSERPCTTFLHKNKKEKYEVYILSCKECDNPLLLNSYIAYYHFCSNRYCRLTVPKDPIYARSLTIRKMFERKQRQAHSYCKTCKKGIIEICLYDDPAKHYTQSSDLDYKKRLTVNICSIAKIVDIENLAKK